MNTSTHKTLLSLVLVTLVTLGMAVPAHAAPTPAAAAPVLAKVSWPDVGSLVPKVSFKAKTTLKKNTVKLSFVALVKVAGKTITIPVFNMGVKKTKKSIRVKRKVGKLSVSLKISWSGTRTLTIKGTAKYLKFKLPVPPIKVRI